MIKALNHVGLSVVDLTRSIDFYRRGFDMVLIEREEFGGEPYASILGLRQPSGEVALLRARSLQIELFEFSNPRPRPSDPTRPVNRHGITHFCVEVSDIDTVYQRLQSVGATFHCPPLLFFGTTRATYGRDPDGNVFELMEEVRRDQP